jgi:hypothetical protein
METEYEKPERAGPNAFDDYSPTLTRSFCYDIPAVPCCASDQKSCPKCGEEKPLKDMHGRQCWECYDKEHPREKHMKKEERGGDEMHAEYFLTPETPSSAHLALASSSSSSSIPVPHLLSDHGKVCIARICPNQMLLLMNLHVLLLLPVGCVCSVQFCHQVKCTEKGCEALVSRDKQPHLCPLHNAKRMKKYHSASTSSPHDCSIAHFLTPSSSSSSHSHLSDFQRGAIAALHTAELCPVLSSRSLLDFLLLLFFSFFFFFSSSPFPSHPLLKAEVVILLQLPFYKSHRYT